jgi:hypothetical protein
MPVERLVVRHIRVLNTLFYVVGLGNFVQVYQVYKSNLASLISKQKSSKLVL